MALHIRVQYREETDYLKEWVGLFWPGRHPCRAILALQVVAVERLVSEAGSYLRLVDFGSIWSVRTAQMRASGVPVSGHEPHATTSRPASHSRCRVWSVRLMALRLMAIPLRSGDLASGVWGRPGWDDYLALQVVAVQSLRAEHGN